MATLDHLHALEDRLAREKTRLQRATTDAERQFRAKQITACEKEIAGERKFLGLDEITLSDDELLAALAQ